MRRAAAMLATPGNQTAPRPTQLPAAPGGANKLQAMLDEIGLPWREPRAAVEARVGRSLDRVYERDALFFADAVRSPGFIQPWRADVFERYAPDMPVVRFSGLAWFADDAVANIRHIADHFAELLGPARVEREYNTLACRWQCGAASLQLQAWPPAWQGRDLRNDAHARELRLRTACHVTLLSGFRLPLSAEEEQWVATSRPVATTRPFLGLGAGGIGETAPGDTEVEYARTPAAHLQDLEPSVGCPPGCEALILVTHQLFVLPARDVIGFEVARLLPAKGGGGSSLMVRCRTTCPTISYKTLRVAEDANPDGSTSLGRELAAMFGVDCDVGAYVDDV